MKSVQMPQRPAVPPLQLPQGCKLPPFTAMHLQLAAAAQQRSCPQQQQEAGGDSRQKRRKGMWQLPASPPALAEGSVDSQQPSAAQSGSVTQQSACVPGSEAVSSRQQQQQVCFMPSMLHRVSVCMVQGKKLADDAPWLQVH